MSSDPFLTALYDRLHDTPMQRKFRRLAPMPVGCVFIQTPDMTEELVRGHFRRMKELGFTCLKNLYSVPGLDLRRMMHWALDEGLIPWWYDEGGWEEISDGLLRKLGLDPQMPSAEIRAHPKFLAHQMQILRARVDAPEVRDPEVLDEDLPQGRVTADHHLAPEMLPHFVRWLKKTYGTVEKLCHAWNMDRTMIVCPREPWKTWEQVEKDVEQVLKQNLETYGKEYRRIRDVLRFKADIRLRRIKERTRTQLARDPHAPLRAGGEMAIFLPFASRAMDMEGVAAEMSVGGSFYPSIHLSWHFEEVDFEITRTVYMQASMCHDWMKGGWSAAWESTGGPQQFSGGKASMHPEAASKNPSFTVDAGVMTQLMLSYLAGGFKGFGFWCWNSRSVGMEAGEFALTDRQGRPGARAVQAGRIGQAARRLRDELWAARKEPLVGIFTDFDNDAYWAAVATGCREHFKHYPMRARVGASRALMNANVPWEYVSGADLRKGLAGRYRVLYLPAVLELDTALLKLLYGYVAAGGRLVLDAPGGWYDEFGRMLLTGRGTDFERLFGASICDSQYASNVPCSLDGHALQGFHFDLEATHAQVLARFDDGRPAATEARVGEGAALVLGYEASLASFRPGNAWSEADLVRHALGRLEPPYACDGALVYRLAAPAADHYFFIADGPAREVVLDTKAYVYKSAQDAVTQEPLPLGQPIALPAHSGRWVRCQRP